MNAIAKIEQRTPEWFAQRVGKITGSRVSAILGLSKYATRQSVLRDMVREYLELPSEFTGNIATQHGEQHEQEAVDAYSAHTGLLVDDAYFVPHHTITWLGASPDGLVGDDGLIEVKCPFRAAYRHIDERPDYYAQIQLQLACTGRKWCDFVVWADGQITISRVDANAQWLENHMQALVEFITDYQELIADTKKADLFAGDTDRSDSEWLATAARYREIKSQIDELTAALEATKADLIDLSGGCSARGGGLSLTASERKGSINYTNAIKGLGLEASQFEAYRGKSSKTFTIKEQQQ